MTPINYKDTFHVCYSNANVALSAHFKSGEFNTSNLDVFMVSEALVARLEQLRAKLNVPIRITSGYRSDSRNSVVGGAKYSEHLTGSAVDIALPSGMSSLRLAAYALSVGFRRIGVAESFVHVGVSPVPAGSVEIWNYGQKNPPNLATIQAEQRVVEATRTA